MTPEELGPELIRLSGRGELTRGKGAELVSQAESQQARSRQLEALRKLCDRLGFAAGMASRARDPRSISDAMERFEESLREFQDWVEQCQFVTPPSESNIDPVRAVANSPA